jgi:hypothetical protein
MHSHLRYPAIESARQWIKLLQLISQSRRETTSVNIYPIFSINYTGKYTTNPVDCLATGRQPLPKRILLTVQVSASFSNFQYSLHSLRPFRSCLRLLPRPPDTSIIHEHIKGTCKLLITMFRINMLLISSGSR